ncbi:putative pyruvate, phosphate dikinase [Helianthus debilis subsp. tardiflorus]
MLMKVNVMTETNPEDVGGMHAADGIITERGGMPSFATMVAFGWGECCVFGCANICLIGDMKVNIYKRHCSNLRFILKALNVSF